MPSDGPWSSIGLPDFKVLPKVTSWLNVAGLVCAGLLLVTYFILPVEKTSRHYLTVGLVVAVCTLQVRWRESNPQEQFWPIQPGRLYNTPRQQTRSMPWFYNAEWYVFRHVLCTFCNIFTPRRIWCDRVG